MATVRVDYTLLLKRLTTAINAAVASTFTLTLDDPRRSAEEIAASGQAADDEVCTLICSSEGSGHRPLFLSDSADLTHGATLPDRIGPIAQVRIKHVSADSDYKAGKFDCNLSLADIERWRANVGSIYGAAHDAANSSLSGYYMVLGDEIYFTGYRARAKVATFTRSAGTMQSPQVYEDAVLAIAITNLVKRGDESGFASMYVQAANAYRQMISAGQMTLPALEVAQA